MTKPTHRPQKSANRRQVIFIASITLVGLLFIVSIVAILTGKFRPNASELPPGGGNQAQDDSVVIRDGVLSYQDSHGNAGNAGINSVALTPKAGSVTGSFSLQGLNGKLDKVASLTGTIKVYQGATYLGQVQWTSTENDTTSRRRFTISDATFLQIINTNPGPFTFALKPKHYLTLLVRNVVDASQPLSFGEAGAGDFNDNDHVGLEDASIAAAYYDQPVTNDTNYLDLNADGRTFNLPDASIFASNYNRDGEQP